MPLRRNPNFCGEFMSKRSKKKAAKKAAQLNHFDVQHRVGTGDGELDLNKIVRKDDGAAVFNVTTMRSGVYEYMAFELPTNLIQRINDAGGNIQNFNDIVRGEIETSETRKLLPQFEGLAVTNEHVFIKPRNIHDSVGRVLARGKMRTDGYVDTRLVLESSDLLSEIETGKKLEVSIGFRANESVVNENMATDSDPHFFLRDIDLNHLAVVERGRAGPEARLSHGQSSQYIHGTPWKHIEVKTMKIKLNGVEHEVNDDLGAEIQAALKAANEGAGADSEKLETAHKALGDANTDLATVRGQVAALEKQIENADPVAQANELLVQHEALAEAIKTLGSKVELKFGAYDAVAVLSTALNEYSNGLAADGASFDALMATYRGVAATVTRKQGSGALEQSHSTPATIGHKVRSDRGRDRVMGMVNDKFFSRPAKTKTEGA